MTNLLEMSGIVRHFGETRANDGIDLSVAPGRIVGLLGENGSGKSTLMKVLFGMIPAQSGSIVVQGRELAEHDPAAAMAAGLAMIHQHFMLVEAMSVLDNVMLNWPPAGRVLRRRAVAARIREASARYGLDLDPHARIADLPLGRRQRVEILKAILRGAMLLILDEPTSNLAPSEIAGLISILRQWRARGAGIIFITHKLPEVMEVCDEVVVLRAGRVAGRMPIAEASPAQLAEMMIGRNVPRAASPTRRAAAGSDRLVIGGLRGPGLHGLDVAVRAGEILGIAGVDGNGQFELAETVAGLRRAASGRIVLDGHDITGLTVAARRSAGLAYIPADRARTSLVGAMSVAENVMLRDSFSPPYSRNGLLQPGPCRAKAAALMDAHDIRAAGPSANVGRLSGGNQQKIVIARELDRRPLVLLAHQAAWGLDPGATRFVLERLLALREAGAAVLYLSSELEEILAISDRVAVLSSGRIAGCVPREAVDMRQLGLWMSGRVAA